MARRSLGEIVLVELAAANAAFAVIKEAVANAGDLMAAGQKVFEYFDAKSAIQKKANSKGNRSDLEEFMALEQLKKQEQELREMMIYNGRAGMWQDWLEFQKTAARKREAAEKAERLRRIKLKERIVNIFWWSVLFVMLAIWMAAATWAIVTFKFRG